MKISRPTDDICIESDVFEQNLTLDGKKIIELGCGRADITRLIASNGKNRQVIATEVDETQHNKNLQIIDLPNVKFIIAGVEEIPFEDNTIDVVFMFKSLHHVPVQLMDKGFQEIHRVLRHGGFAYISEPVFAGEFNEILRLFHNEQIVRQAAFNAIRRSVEKELFVLEKELFFNTISVYDSFEEFENRIINVSHTEHTMSPELHKKIKEKFMQHMNDNGARFQVPIRVDLLKK